MILLYQRTNINYKNKAMRTIEKISRKATRTLSLCVAFIFVFSLAAEAQRTLKSEDFDQLSYIINVKKDKLITIIFSSAVSNEVMEKDIKFENWMADLDEWAGKADSGSYKAHEMERFFEQEMSFEDWMFEKDLTKKESLKKNEPQKLESWMHSPADWTIASH
jgi:hypothetical protein